MAPNTQEISVSIRHSSEAKMYLLKINNFLFCYTYHQCSYDLSKPSGDVHIKADLARIIFLVFLLDHVANFRKYLKELEIEKLITIVSISSMLLIGNMFSQLIDLLNSGVPGELYKNLNCPRVVLNLCLISLFWIFFFMTIALCIASLYMSSKVTANGFRQIFFFWLFLLVHKARKYIVIFGSVSFVIVLLLPYVNVWLDYIEVVTDHKLLKSKYKCDGDLTAGNSFVIVLGLVSGIYLVLLLVTFYVSLQLTKLVKSFEGSLVIAAEHKLILYSLEAATLAQSGPIDTKTLNRIIEDTWELGCDCIRSITAADYNNILNEYIFDDYPSHFYRITYHVVGFWKFKCMTSIEKLELAEKPRSNKSSNYADDDNASLSEATDPKDYNRINKTFKLGESSYQVMVVEHPESYMSYNYVDYVKHYNLTPYIPSIFKRIWRRLCCDCGYSEGSALKRIDIVKSVRRFVQLNDRFQHNKLIIYILHLLRKPYPVMSYDYVQSNFTQFIDISQELRKNGFDGIHSLDLFNFLGIEFELPSEIVKELYLVEKERKSHIAAKRFLESPEDNTIVPWPIKVTGNYSYISASLQIVFCIKANMGEKIKRHLNYELFSEAHWKHLQTELVTRRRKTTQNILGSERIVSAISDKSHKHTSPGFVKSFFGILEDLYLLRKHTVTPDTLFNIRYLFAQQRNTNDELKSKLEHDPTCLLIKMLKLMFFGSNASICCRFVQGNENELCEDLYGSVQEAQDWKRKRKISFHERNCRTRRFMTINVHQTLDISTEDFKSAVQEQMKRLDVVGSKTTALQNSILVIKLNRYEIIKKLDGGSFLSNKTLRKVVYPEELKKIKVADTEFVSYNLIGVVMHSGNSPHNNDGSYYCRMKLQSKNYLYWYEDGISPNFPCHEWPFVKELNVEPCNSNVFSGCSCWRCSEQANALILVYLLQPEK